ncbi:hypothetical protein BASA60_009722 [Batrachochytrium salamandrivorans]|nr:hypothetical protein BASA60_009722 [Batrachochytrium salamandrivorans]
MSPPNFWHTISGLLLFSALPQIPLVAPLVSLTIRSSLKYLPRSGNFLTLTNKFRDSKAKFEEVMQISEMAQSLVFLTMCRIAGRLLLILATLTARICRDGGGGGAVGRGWSGRRCR